MNNKKSKSADLSRNRSNFILLGGVIATAFVLMAFEWSTYNGNLELRSNNTDALYDIPMKEIPLDLKKPTPSKPKPKTSPVPTRKDEVEEKKTTDVLTKPTKMEMDTTQFIDLAISGDEGEEVMDIDPIEFTEPNAEIGDPNVKIPFYDVCENATYDEKLNCISGKIHATLMDGLANITPEQIERNKSDKMYVKFVISKEGTITDVLIHNESNFQKGIVRQVKSTMTNVPVMHPATRYGKKVAINFSIPIRFSAD